MPLAPGDKFPVLTEDGIDELIEDVVSGFSDEFRVRVKRLVVLLVETHDVAYHALASRARLDHRHDGLHSAAAPGAIPASCEGKRTALRSRATGT